MRGAFGRKERARTPARTMRWLRARKATVRAAIIMARAVEQPAEHAHDQTCSTRWLACHFPHASPASALLAMHSCCRAPAGRAGAAAAFCRRGAACAPAVPAAAAELEPAQPMGPFCCGWECRRARGRRPPHVRSRARRLHTSPLRTSTHLHATMVPRIGKPAPDFKVRAAPITASPSSTFPRFRGGPPPYQCAPSLPAACWPCPALAGARRGGWPGWWWRA